MAETATHRVMKEKQAHNIGAAQPRGSEIRRSTMYTFHRWLGSIRKSIQ
jgi:hypothetical protein